MSTRAFACIVALLLVVPSTASAERRSKLDRALRAALASSDRAPKRVIVQTRPGAQAAVKRALAAHGDVVEVEHPTLDAFTVTVHASDLASLDGNPAVISVSVDGVVTAFGAPDKDKDDRDRKDKDKKDKDDDERNRKDKKDDDDDDERERGRGDEERDERGISRYRALNILRASLGVDGSRVSGEGVNVAIIDSGIAPKADLASSIAGFWDFTRGGIAVRPFDDYGHGTHMAGLIASSGRASNSEFGGVAPSVRLYGFKVLDCYGRGRVSDVVRALEWIVANRRSGARHAVRIDVVNLSLGHPVYEPAATDPLVRAVENAVRAGIVVVVAAGNQGQEADGSVGYAGITSPGNAPSAITVGAADTRQTARRSDDRVAGFSSRGPTWFDAFAKPDVVAPGVALTAEAADDAQLYQTYPSLKLTGKHRNYGRLSGTSVATATASGVVALVLEASREANDGSALTPNAVKAVLQYTAIPVDGADALSQGSGQVNGRGALALAALIDPTMPAGQWWVRTPPPPVSTIAGHVHEWSRTIVWHDSAIRGADAIFLRSQLWDDNIVWGTGCDTDEAHCLATVWGAAAEADNIVWGSLAWAEDLVYRDRVVGLLAGDNIVWGTFAGLRADNIVWGTILDADNIVWGTLRGDNIVWGTLRGDNIVWGTLRFADNIVWGTLRGDNIVWGTVSDGVEGGRQ